jgi:UDP-glucose 4-epimerase
VRVLVTGHRGRLGVAICHALDRAGHGVVGFDVTDDCDVRDPEAVRAVAAGAGAIVHLAGLTEDQGADPAEIMSVTVTGTWNVLLAARAHGVTRVVYFSSGKALGMLERKPSYLPIDDDHPGLPSRPYGLAKWLAEEMCEAFTRDTGIATICLRPVAVRRPGERTSDPQGSSDRPWDMGVWVDVRDVAAATIAALACPDPGHTRLLLCADDIAAERPTLELVREMLPDVEWRSGLEYRSDSRRALVDTTRARETLGWAPRYRWDDPEVPSPHEP